MKLTQLIYIYEFKFEPQTLFIYVKYEILSNRLLDKKIWVSRLLPPAK
jgi:hypothetical protein